MNDFNQLNDFTEVDNEKRQMLKNLEKPKVSAREMCCKILDECDDNSNLDQLVDLKYDAGGSDSSIFTKFCPECGRRFSHDENFCPECLINLRNISDGISIRDIKTNPQFTYTATKESDNILSDENFTLLSDFDFNMDDFSYIIHSIRAQAFKNMDHIIKDNSVRMDDLDILDKVLLFAKSFVSVEYKSYGQDLGYFEFNRIFIDDRQRKSLQITTLIHELTHFLIKEILIHITCKILDVSKNRHIEAVVTYILSNSILNRLIDEYAAHSVEGRFTIFGYQDYSSFVVLQHEIDPEHIEISKTIGNTFSIHIKEMLEGFLDWDLREEIKEQFLKDTIESPDYSQLSFETCNKLSDEGFLKAIWLILTEGFKSIDINVIDSYMKEFSK